MTITLPTITNIPVDTLQISLEESWQFLIKFRQEVQSGPNAIRTMKAPASVDALFQFTQKLNARAIAGTTIGDGSKLQQALLNDVDAMLHGTIAVLEEIQAQRPKQLDQLSLDRAKTRYAARAVAHTEFMYTLKGILQTAGTPMFIERTSLTNEKTDKLSVLRVLKDEPMERILRVVARMLPVDPVLDDDISTLLDQILIVADTEPVFATLRPESVRISRSLLVYDAIASDQQFRDYIGATVTSYLKGAFINTDIKAYDPLFRNCYFAVVQYLMKYYREHAEELKAQAAKLEEQQAGMQNATELAQGATAATSTTSEPVANETLLELAQEPSASTQIPINGRMGAIEPISTEVQPPVDVPPAQPAPVAPVEPAQPIPVDKQTSKIKPINLS